MLSIPVSHFFYRVSVRVTGRVQGVFFRASTQREAERLGIVGSARNCDDGSVQVLATGEEAAIEQLLAWLAHGPILARVDDLQWESIKRLDFVGFSVR